MPWPCASHSAMTTPAAPVSSWLSATRTARAWAPTTSRHPAPPGSSPLPPTSTPAPTTAPWPRRWPRWLSRPGAVLPGADPADPPQVGLLPREPIGDRLANAVRHCSSARPLPIDDSDDPSGTCRPGACRHRDPVTAGRPRGVMPTDIVDKGRASLFGLGLRDTNREEEALMSHSRAKLTPEGRLLVVQRVTEHRWTPAQTAEAMGVSRATVYKWLHRYREEGEAGLQDRSSRPHR